MIQAAPGISLNKSNFCVLLARAWQQALTKENIKSGFRATGIFPYNPEAIPEHAYLPSTATIPGTGT